MKASPLKEEAFLLSEGFRGKYIANGKEKCYNRFRGDYMNTGAMQVHDFNFQCVTY